LDGIDVLRRVDGPLEPGGPHLEVGRAAKAIEVVTQSPGKFLESLVCKMNDKSKRPKLKSNYTGVSVSEQGLGSWYPN